MGGTPLCVAVAVLTLLSGCERESADRLEWTTMGTVAALQFRGDTDTQHAAIAACRQVCDRVTAAFNAHDPASRLSQLAELSDQDVLVAADAFARPCYAAAFRLMSESGGAFNPRWRGPKTLDLGAIAKGYALDVIAEACAKLPPCDRLADIGGNLKCLSGRWTVGIAGSDKTFVLTNGMACATSAEYFRGKHIRDGRTNLPVTNDVVSVTVIHPTSAMLADGLSTTLFVLGPVAGEAFRATHYPEARAFWVLK